MRWSCPHCGTKLSLSDDQLGPGWSFARCHRCQGHSLIRKSEVNVIKIDRAPAGENVLFPAAPDERTGSAPEISISAPTPSENTSPSSLTAARAASAMGSARPPSASPSRRISPLVSIAIGVAGAMTVFSGIYLYLEGQDLWEKARVKTVSSFSSALPAPPQSPPARADIISAPPLVPHAPAAKSADVTDHVHQNAMAPERDAIRENSGRPAGLLVQPKQEDVKLRSGPGLNFPVIGYGARDLKYHVADWNDRWFRIQIPGSEQTAWIRNDLVELSTR